MDERQIKKISNQVFRQFPEVSGAAPKVRAQAGAKGSGEETYLITYQGSARTADGKSISRMVRVVATAGGKILKITTSR